MSFDTFSTLDHRYLHPSECYVDGSSVKDWTDGDGDCKSVSL